jgi:hypothetical protein
MISTRRPGFTRITNNTYYLVKLFTASFHAIPQLLYLTNSKPTAIRAKVVNRDIFCLLPGLFGAQINGLLSQALSMCCTRNRPLLLNLLLYSYSREPPFILVYKLLWRRDFATPCTYPRLSRCDNNSLLPNNKRFIVCAPRETNIGQLQR